jgi:hypothetical protein
MRFPVRGEEPIGALPKDSNPRCGVPGVSLNAPRHMQIQGAVQGNIGDAMTTSNHIV